MGRRIGLALVLILCFTNTKTSGQVVEFLAQNWNEETRQKFYTTSQGSRLLPYKWFLALEMKDSTELFSGVHLKELGFLPNATSTANPDGLPVGFVQDEDWAGKRHLGLTCAACHTSQIKFKTKTLQIDGGPTLADTWGLIQGIGESLNATQQNPAKWSRFEAKVLGTGASESDRQVLKEEYVAFLSYFNAFVDASRTPHLWGRGRLDAFGMIFNRVSSIDLDLPQNSAPPDAPVSFPFLWGTSWENQVQWNGSAPNTNDIERLGRNIGEVLGVFAQTDLEKASILRPYYRTSTRRVNQLRLENWLKVLWSPEWPRQLEDLDEVKVSAGRKLFVDNCVRCHEVVPHQEQDRPVIVAMTPLSEVKTDPRTVTNAATRVSVTGRLEGSNLPGLDPLPNKVATGALVQNVARGALLSPFRDVDQSEFKLTSLFQVKDIIKKLDSQRITDRDLVEFLSELGQTQDQVAVLVKQFEAKSLKYINDLRITSDPLPEGANSALRSTAVATKERLLAYKGRPLDGIWATAPYLHNGSVPNLYELLLPADERTKQFHVGNIEFDSKKVGFKTEAGPGTTLLDTTLPGNRNTGHDMYGYFNENERWALVEYMKSL
jgi:cytochrome c peroxidase